jgi:hypothetical protein
MDVYVYVFLHRDKIIKRKIHSYGGFFVILQLHMGRHPLLSNRCTEPVAPCSSPPLTDSEPCVAFKISLACLSNVAGHHREKLVAEVEEVDGDVPPRMELAAEVQLVPEVEEETVGSNVSHTRCMSLFF